MADHIIKNSLLKAKVSDHGAELRSLVSLKSNSEIMWQADPKYWGRTSPVLFPIVGGLWEKKYTYKGESYSLSQHGFARDMDFALVKEAEDELVFELCANEETLKKYPFSFSLKIGYKLEGAKLTVSYIVKNAGTGDMYFSIGAHPRLTVILATTPCCLKKAARHARIRLDRA